jgi:hypothetical protein
VVAVGFSQTGDEIHHKNDNQNQSIQQ